MTALLELPNQSKCRLSPNDRQRDGFALSENDAVINLASSSTTTLIFYTAYCDLLINLAKPKMALKRKRSSSAVSPFSSSSSATPSSRDPSASPCPDVLMLDDSSCAIPRPDVAPSDLHSRTRKRYRDNRPDEAVVHGTYLAPHSEPFIVSPPPI